MNRFAVALLPVLAVIGTAATLNTSSSRAAVAQTAPAAAPTWEVDAVHSVALFRVKHLGAGAFWGRFTGLKGSFQYADGADSLQCAVEIPMSGIDSGNKDLDAHLRSADFFDAEKNPTMNFQSKSVKKVDDRLYDVTGDLTIRGVTKSITAKFEWVGTADFGRGARCGLEATFTIKRSDFGVSYGVANGAVSDETRIIVALEGVKKP